MKERLFRSRKSRVIAGVAGGLGEYLNLDPVLVRIIFVIITFLHGIGVILYIILWIVVQENPEELPVQEKSGEQNPQPDDSQSNQEDKAQAKEVKKSGSGRVVAGIILIGLGFIFLAERFFPYYDFIDFFPVILIIIGLILLWNSARKK